MQDRRATREVLAAEASAPAQILGVALGVTAVFVEFLLLTLLTLAVLAVPASIIAGLLVTALAPDLDTTPRTATDDHPHSGHHRNGSAPDPLRP